MNDEEAAQGGEEGGILEEHSCSIPEADGNGLLHILCVAILHQESEI